MQTWVTHIIRLVTGKKTCAEILGQRHVFLGRRWFLKSLVWLGAVAIFTGLECSATAFGASFPAKKKVAQPDVAKETAGAGQAMVADWPVWIKAAKRGIKQNVPLWVSGLKFPGIVVNGPVAMGGRLVPTFPLEPLIMSSMQEVGAPPQVVLGFMGAVAAAWQSWAASVSVPGLPWYPVFAAFPSPVAPPIPNIPTPLLALAQNSDPLLPQNLAATIKGVIGETATMPGGSDGIDEFCRWMNAGFVAWQSTAQVTNVMGIGPIPSFAPPYAPVGSVVGGSTLGSISIVPLPSWP